MSLKKNLITSLLSGVLFLFILHSDTYSKTYIIWVDCMEHQINYASSTQDNWLRMSVYRSFVNGAFFFKSFKPLPPYMSSNGRLSWKNNSRWWAINRIDNYSYELEKPGSVLDYSSNFVISVCPPIIYNGDDIDIKTLRKYGSNSFLNRICNRTMIGKTFDGEIFICNSRGSVYFIRNYLKSKINNIKWLANLDGGSSSFLTVDGKRLVRTNRSVPSIISFNYSKIEVFLN